MIETLRKTNVDLRKRISNEKSKSVEFHRRFLKKGKNSEV